ncbi:glycoside hydrolase family 2 protein [Ramaria rubella]|nr:glycoside hydrolase family 2 protein [Ramaria rubella]
MANIARVLKSDWLWKQRDTSIGSVVDEVAADRLVSWNKAASIPSEIHVELLKSGKIPDPYLGANEHSVQWVGEREWLFATHFAHEQTHHTHAQLTFEGLDTFCTVYLNGSKILDASNMFMPYTVEINPKTLYPTNTLLLHFHSAKLIAKELEKKYGRVRAGSCNLGDPSRVYVRKAQYDWRWDWGPELLTAGPWQPVIFGQYTAAFSTIHTKAAVSADLRASLSVDIALSGDAEVANNVKIVMKDAYGRILREGERKLQSKEPDSKATDVVNWTFTADEIKLWWPVGYGDQVLYDVEVTLEDEATNTLDRIVKRIGFRRVQLVQEALSEPDRYGKGTSFLFEVNGVRIFIGGSNWVPGDSFLTTITPERYRAWLQLLKDGNQNMVRLWGGGVYEPDVFYDICDELGILVWQDFQFACGVYPAHEEFINSVKKEAEATVTRLRHHPSMALFCGNNEDYQQVLQWGGIDSLPARVIYEEVLPDVVSRLTSPEVPYWRGSPYGGKGWDTADPTIGDVHQWNVWAGAHHLYQDYDIMGGRFVSEFGMPAFPDIRTVDYWMDGAEKKHRYSQSKLMMQHNKAGSHERRFAILMNENFRITSDLESYIYLTQLNQSEGVGHAYRSWRREWRGKGKEYCSGVIVWQLNDCWPVTSWAIADYFLRPKAVYFTIARELQPITVGIFRQVQQNRETDRPRQFYEFGAFQSRSATIDVWATNSRLESREATLELNFFDLESDWTHTLTRTVVLGANQTTEILSMPVAHRPVQPNPDPDSDPQVTPSHSVIVSAKLVDPRSGEVTARYSDWPQPYRVLDLPDPGLQVTVENEVVSIEVDRPLKGLVLSVEGEGKEVKWSDNNLDIVPGDPRRILADGIGGRKLRVAYLGKEKPSAVQ